MRAGGPKIDICIRDLSKLGMLIQTGTPPPRGTYVEIMCAHLPVVAKVIWTSDRRFGVAMRDPIDVRSFIDEVERPGSAARAPPAIKPKAYRERPNAASTFERSRGAAGALQFAAIAAACAVAAFVIANGLYEHLSQTFGAVASNL